MGSQRANGRGQYVICKYDKLEYSCTKAAVKSEESPGRQKEKSPLEAKGPKDTTVGHYLSFLKEFWIL